MSQMLKSSGAMAAATMFSRVLGMVREMVYAAFMGDGWVAWAFQLAFTVPNLFRRLLGEGALTAAFIPIFKEKERTGTKEEMWRAANAVVSGLLIAATSIIAVVMIGVTAVLAVGSFSAKVTLMLELLRVMFPYMLLVCLAAVFMGILNSKGHFFIPAMGAALLNVAMISSVLFLAPVMGKELHEKIFALAIGVLVAGIAQAAFQMPVLMREGYRFRWVTPWGDETVRRVVRQMIPGAIGVAAFQINILIVQGVGIWMDPSVVASFNYAVRLMELPQGVFGVSLATYLLPTLAGLAAEKKFPEFRGMLRHGLEHIVFVNLLASILLFVLAEPIIRLLFESGKFGPDATIRATYALTCLAPALLAFSLSNILARAFYAVGDLRTPMKISIVCLVVNLVFVLALVWPLKQGGLGIANSISATFNVVLLTFALRKKLGKLEWGGLKKLLFPVIVAGAVAGIIAWEAHQLWEGWIGHADVARQIGAVFVPAFLAGFTYWGLTAWMKVGPAREMAGMILKKLTGKN